MSKRTCIGDDRREATDWLQDRLNVTRPLAERAMISLLREGVAITTVNGIMLTEDEEEAEGKARVNIKSAVHKASRSRGTSHQIQRAGVVKIPPHYQRIEKQEYSETAEGLMFSFKLLEDEAAKRPEPREK